MLHAAGPFAVTAYRSTGIPNITTYFVMNGAGAGMKLAGPLAGLLSRGAVRSLAEKIIDWTISGPDAEQRQHGRSLVWACAERADGAFYEAWLDTVEAYRFTALASVRAVERVLDERPVGALTPSQAFGADFVLEIEGTVRRDTLP